MYIRARADGWHWLLVLLVLFAGCSTVPEAPGPDAESRWQARQLALNALQDWTLDGRIAIQRETEGWFASLHWLQRGSAYQLQVSGPAGQGAARLSGDDTGVTLTLGNGTAYHALRPEALLAAHLGWQVPVAGLRYWIRGLPAPSSREESRQLDVMGRLVALRQDGWKIRFERYTAVGALELPGRVVLESPPLAVRIVADQWAPTVGTH